MTEGAPAAAANEQASEVRSFSYRVLRYTPNIVRDEWVNIGVLVFDPYTGERRLRLIEGEEEYRRVRRMLPVPDEGLLRALRDNLEERFQTAMDVRPAAGSGTPEGLQWLTVTAKWDQTLSNALQFTLPKGIVEGGDLDSQVERLYADHVAVPQRTGRVGVPGSRGAIRSYCAQVLRQARLWERIDKAVRAEEYTFPGDPMRLDFSYRRNGTRGFVQTLSVTRAPADAKLLAYTAERIHAKARLATEFAAVTDVPLLESNERHRFVRDTLRDVGVEPIPMEGFAVWVAKLRPMLQ